MMMDVSQHGDRSQRTEAIALIRFLLWACDEAAALQDEKTEMLLYRCISHLKARFGVTRDDLFPVPDRKTS